MEKDVTDMKRSILVHYKVLNVALCHIYSVTNFRSSAILLFQIVAERSGLQYVHIVGVKDYVLISD